MDKIMKKTLIILLGILALVLFACEPEGDDPHRESPTTITN
jgi:hypothetical protein